MVWTVDGGREHAVPVVGAADISPASRQLCPRSIGEEAGRAWPDTKSDETLCKNAALATIDLTQCFAGFVMELSSESNR